MGSLPEQLAGVEHQSVLFTQMQQSELPPEALAETHGHGQQRKMD